MIRELDYVNRDPNNINDHLFVSFEDVLAEPDGAHSLDCVWAASYACYNFWKKCCYACNTMFCGMCIAGCWGCHFACVSFMHVWHVTPCFKSMAINCGCLQKFYGMCIHCCMDPWCESCGNLFAAFKKS
ncbi:hypothetical protein BsWGS_11419 [Bradybaena similaris]